jgi:hypothetical protein
LAPPFLHSSISENIGSESRTGSLRINSNRLGMIVLIRTFLSLSLQLEIEGKLPWQRDGVPGKQN